MTRHVRFDIRLNFTGLSILRVDKDCSRKSQYVSKLMIRPT